MIEEYALTGLHRYTQDTIAMFNGKANVAFSLPLYAVKKSLLPLGFFPSEVIAVCLRSHYLHKHPIFAA